MIALSYALIFLGHFTMDQILSSLPAVILMVVGCYYLIFDFFVSISLLYLIFYYFQLRCLKVNEKLTNIYEDSGLNNKTVEAVINDHNSICSQIANYNKFWQKQYSGIIFCIIPISLVLLHQVMFEKLKVYSQVFFWASYYFINGDIWPRCCSHLVLFSRGYAYSWSLTWRLWSHIVFIWRPKRSSKFSGVLWAPDLIPRLRSDLWCALKESALAKGSASRSGP